MPRRLGIERPFQNPQRKDLELPHLLGSPHDGCACLQRLRTSLVGETQAARDLLGSERDPVF